MAELFGRHGRAVRRYLRGATGSAELAEDLAQDVFVRVVRSVGQYEPRERERAWLFRIARNILLDHRRRLAARPSSGGVVAHAVVGPTQALRTDLDSALASLPEAEREAFLLAELGGLTYRRDLSRPSNHRPGSPILHLSRAARASDAAFAPGPLTDAIVKGTPHDD